MIAAICDDEPSFRQIMKKFLLEYRTSRRLHIDIVEFTNGKELLDYKYPCDIVFLDYDMPVLDGMNVARELRARKSLSCIIFVTSFPQYVFDAYEVNTYRYLVKPLDFEKAGRSLDDYIKDRKMFAPITVNIECEQITINSEDIIYLEADGKYCNIRTDSDFFHSSKTLSQVYNLLPQHCFYRTHKSYAINFYCITSIKENTVFLTNGERVMISRTKIADFKKSYKDFIKHFVLKNY